MRGWSPRVWGSWRDEATQVGPRYGHVENSRCYRAGVSRVEGNNQPRLGKRPGCWIAHVLVDAVVEVGIAVGIEDPRGAVRKKRRPRGFRPEQVHRFEPVQSWRKQVGDVVHVIGACGQTAYLVV